MFTQCPECGTVFRVTAAVLRAAQGQVRCGVCDANFDALRFLTDAVEGEVPAPTAPAAPEPPAEPPAARAVAPELPRAPPRPTPGAPPAPPPPPRAPPPARSSPAPRTTASADADRELAATLARDAHAAELRASLAAVTAARERTALAAAARAAEAADEVNVLEPSDVENIVLGGEEISEASLEFNVPPGEWDSVFVEDVGATKITPLDINLGELEGSPANVAAEVSAAEQLLTLIDSPPAPAAHPPAAPQPPADAPSAGELTLAEEDPLSRTDEYALLELELADRRAVARVRAEPAPDEETEPVEIDIEGAPEDGGVHVEDTWFDHAHASPSSAAHAPAEDAGPAVPAAPAFDLPFDDSGLVAEREPVARPERRRVLAAGISALGVALAAQLVHQNREALGANELVGAPVRALYARLGRPIEPRWDLGAYDVKQWGAATDTAPGALRLRASVVNRANRAQPYPLLRVTLEDRFGAKVAQREFTPVEYLPGHTAPGQLLAPGARADADLSLADPGSQAVGFELDVCLPRAGVVTCGTEPKSPGAG